MTDHGDRWLAAWSLGYATVGAASVLVPLYAIELGAGALVVAVVGATAASAGIPGALLWGRLAARSGRYRPFLLASLALSAAAFAALPFADSLAGVVAANAALLFGVSAAAPVLALLVVAGHPDSEWERRVGALNAWQGYGWLGGLLAGAAWTAVGTRYTSELAAHRWFFAASAASCAVATLLAWAWLPGRPDVSSARFGRAGDAIEGLQRGAGRGLRLSPFSGLRSFWALRRLDPRVLAARLTPPLAGYLAAAALFFAGFAAFFGPLPAYLAGDQALGSDRVFALFVVSSAASAAAYGPAGRVAAARTPQSALTAALAVRTATFPGVAFVAVLGALAFPGFVAAFVVLGLTWAVVAVAGTSIVARLAPPAIRGDALGAYAALGGLGTAAGSVLGGALASAHGYVVAFVAASALVLAGLAVAALAPQSTPVPGGADGHRS
ncbi:MFS transporter [Halobacterium yunchengense]|uniref:MFS transporter n=1 Tax=Halobacterium yunchengense TaxID=3108497 RepID=UPI00300BBAE3